MSTHKRRSSGHLLALGIALYALMVWSRSSREDPLAELRPLMERGSFEEALGAIEDLRASDRGGAEAVRLQAICLLALGEQPKAVRTLQEGISAHPTEHEGDPEDAVAQVEDEPELAPAPARLPERAKEMWEHKQAGDWIQVYDFLAPEYKRAVPLGKFLRGKENHIYEDASNPHVLKIEGDRGFVEIHVQWTPTHPILSTVDNGGGSLTEILDEVDEWVWTDGEWWLAQQHRVSELRKTHPHLWASGEQG